MYEDHPRPLPVLHVVNSREYSQGGRTISSTSSSSYSSSSAKSSSSSSWVCCVLASVKLGLLSSSSSSPFPPLSTSFRGLMARTKSLKMRTPRRPPLYCSPFEGIQDTSGLWNKQGADQIVIRAQSHLFRVDRRVLYNESGVFRAAIKRILPCDLGQLGTNYCPWVEVDESPSNLRVLLHFLCTRCATQNDKCLTRNQILK